MKKNNISIRSCERILKITGFKVSQKASMLLRDKIEEYANNLAKLSSLSAKNKRRVTIKAEDIEFVLKLNNMKGGI